MQIILLSMLGSCMLGILSMYAVDTFLMERIAIMGSFVGLERSYNEGVAFGVHLGVYQAAIIAVAFLLVAFIAIKYAKRTVEQWGFGLMLGGGMANIIDRLLDGAVTDMIQIGSFPIFNIADICINIGLGLLLLDMLLQFIARKSSCATMPS